MKTHKYWAVGALACMVATFYTGVRGKMKEHKIFAIGAMGCMLFSVLSGYKMISVKGAVKKSEEVEKANGWPEGTINIIVAIESVRGLYNVREICHGPRVVAIALGAEDYRADLRTGKHKPAVELLFARQTILHAAREAGIRVIDTVFSDVKDPQGFREEVEFIKALGYDGKSCIHPSQIKIIHEVFTPDEKEIAHSVKVLNSYADALRNNKGVISVDGKMIDGPIVVRAQRVVDKARAAGIKVELEEGAEYDVK